uniref:Variant surface glycoprotein n=1 Tax=Trypanosoma brucei TaxID=5691 RepID=S5FWS9_9TRYP|nr:variant surface glycoprotein [Trypanosoma brucei]
MLDFLEQVAEATMSLTALVKLLVFTTAVLQTEASHSAINEAKVTALCTVANQLSKTGEVAAYKYNQLKEAALASVQATGVAHQAAASTQDFNTSALYKAIALGAEKCLEDTLNDITTLTPLAIKAVTNGAKTAGHIAELTELLRKATKMRSAGAGYCLGSATTATEANSVTDLSCPPEFIEAAQPTESLDKTILTAGGYSNLDGEATFESNTGQTSCGFLIGTNGNTANFWMAQTPPAQSVMAGFMTLKPHNSANSEKATLTKLNAGAEAGKFSSPDSTPKKVFNAITDLTTHSVAGCGRTADEVLAQVAEGNSALEILTDVLASQPNYKAEGAAMAAAKAIRKTAAEGADSGIGEKIKDKIKQARTERLEGAQVTTKQLKDAQQPQGARRSLLLSHLNKRQQLAKLASQLTAEKSKHQSASKQLPNADACKSKTGDDCKDGCRWEGTGDNKQCVVDKTYKPKQEEGAKDNKVTNTAGSNSFVINKAPLLLAVSLF